MRFSQLLSLLAYLIGALLLVTGHRYNWQTPAVSAGPAISARNFHADLAVWAPPHEEFRLRAPGQDRLQSPFDSRCVDTYVRPIGSAWVILTGMIFLFLYLLGTPAVPFPIN